MTENLGISVFVPMYNEEANAGILLPSLIKNLIAITPDFEIVVVDDASRDRTVALVEDYARRDARIRLVRHEHNLGYGAALRTGFLSVTKDVVFYTDADVPIDFSILGDVVPRLRDHPVILGFRIERADTPKRWLFSKAYNFLLRTFFGVRVRDINFSCKFFRHDIVDRFKNELRAESVLIDGEILVWLTRNRVSFIEWPVDYRPRKHGLSTLGSWKQVWLTVTEIIDLYFQRGPWGKRENKST